MVAQGTCRKEGWRLNQEEPFLGGPQREPGRLGAQGEASRARAVFRTCSQGPIQRGLEIQVSRPRPKPRLVPSSSCLAPC